MDAGSRPPCIVPEQMSVWARSSRTPAKTVYCLPTRKSKPQLAPDRSVETQYVRVASPLYTASTAKRMLIRSALEITKPVIGGSMTVTVPRNTTSARAACCAPVCCTHEQAFARTPRPTESAPARTANARKRSTLVTIAPAYHRKRAKEEPRPRRMGTHHLRGSNQTDPGAREIRDHVRRAASAPLRRQRRRYGATRRTPVRARDPTHDVPRATLDHAPVRRVRDGGGVERALPLLARAWPDRSIGRVRSSDADGLRRRRPACGGRGRQGRRVDQLARRFRAALRGHPARRGHDVYDHQRDRDDPARHVRRRRQASGDRARAYRRHDAKRHPQGVHRARDVHLPAASVDAPGN